MVTMELGIRDAMLLREMLENDLSDLWEEIYKTEDAELKVLLKEREALLHRLIDRLSTDTRQDQVAA